MKRFDITMIIAGIMTMVSCQQELFPEDVLSGDLIDMTVEAVVDNGPESKTSLGGTNADLMRNVLWNADDAIAFFASGSTSFAKFVNLNESDGQNTARFSGSVEKSNQYAAFYPYANVQSLSQDTVYFSMPQVQTYMTDGFADGVSPMIASLNNNRLSFKNLCGILVVNLKGEGTVSSISFKGYDENGDKMPVAGIIGTAYDYESEPTLSMTDFADYQVILNCEDGVSLSETSATPFHMILPPGQYHDFVLTINLADGRRMVKEGVNPITIRRSERTRTKPLTFVEMALPDIDLNASGETANSYIISEPGNYKFKALKGNSSDPVGLVASVEVLWESFGTDIIPNVGDLIKNVSYSDGCIQFSTQATFKEGNAVIAAKNASGTILWSWHIWLTDQPESQVYANGAGTMMDRNLGATSAIPGDVGSLGLLYQWGRKDPFLGSSSISGGSEAKSTGAWPSSVQSNDTRGAIEYAVNNPKTYITRNESNYDWYYTGSAFTDDTRWQSDKTIYDPCPPGWRIPDGDSDGIWERAGFNDVYYDSNSKGMSFAVSSSPMWATVWYPAAGYRNGSDKMLTDIGSYGYYWSVDVDDINAHYFGLRDVGLVGTLNSRNRAHAQSVRCQKINSETEYPGLPSGIVYEDLSAGGTANSYIVSQAGHYRFKSVYGNSNIILDGISSVEVLWESFGTDVAPYIGSMIKNPSYSDGYICFSTNPIYKEGNAVIAAKDASGTVIWSWHIWMTDKPAEHVYYNDAGTMMDRNLGATSAVPGEVGSLGLHYQWGRKDPFLGASATSYGSIALSSVSWPSSVSSYTGNSYTSNNPMTYIYHLELPFDCWQAEKTIYDPCPAGWRVPDGGEDGVWAKAGFDGGEYENLGKSYSIYSPSVTWYPFAGYNYSGKDISNTGFDGYYWSVTPDGEGYIYTFSTDQNSSNTSDYNSRSYAYSVRCLKVDSEQNVPAPPAKPDAVDLSVEGTANSYIVSKAGDYKFKTVKGNSSESVGSNFFVDVLWESYGTDETPSEGSLVKDIYYSDGYIHFSTGSVFKEGNAVIAAKNAYDECLWSWHIWLTDMPQEQVYSNNAGIMMDRNLGATSATPGDVGALGLLYQWGRKDPFLGSSSIGESVIAKSTGSWPSSVSSSSSTGTIDYATKHPMTFIIYNGYNDDWYYTDSSSTDDTRWQIEKKTIYDPCPAGWRVPAGGDDGVWAKAGFNDQGYDSVNEGMLFDSPYCTPAAWYPASGVCSIRNSFYNVGYGGYYWSVTPKDERAYYLYFDGISIYNVYTSYTDYRATGMSVRCLKE